MACAAVLQGYSSSYQLCFDSMTYCRVKRCQDVKRLWKQVALHQFWLQHIVSQVFVQKRKARQCLGHRRMHCKVVVPTCRFPRQFHSIPDMWRYFDTVSIIFRPWQMTKPVAVAVFPLGRILPLGCKATQAPAACRRAPRKRAAWVVAGAQGGNLEMVGLVWVVILNKYWRCPKKYFGITRLRYLRSFEHLWTSFNLSFRVWLDTSSIILPEEECGSQQQLHQSQDGQTRRRRWDWTAWKDESLVRDNPPKSLAWNGFKKIKPIWWKLCSTCLPSGNQRWLARTSPHLAHLARWCPMILPFETY